MQTAELREKAKRLGHFYLSRSVFNSTARTPVVQFARMTAAEGQQA